MPLKTRSLQFQYNNSTRFEFPDINLGESEHQLIVGQSGHGKTTFLHLLAGILKPTGGHISINDVDITNLKSRKLDHFRGKNIGLVFQRAYFVKSLNVKDNLLLAQKLAGKDQDLKVIKTILDELNIEVKLSALPTELSVGEQQRISIARAVLNHPAIILADEPTSALDDVNAEKVAGLLERSARTQNANLLVVTHDNRLKHRFSKIIEL